MLITASKDWSGKGRFSASPCTKSRPGSIVSFSAEGDAGRVQVQSRVGGRVQGAHEV